MGLDIGNAISISCGNLSSEKTRTNILTLEDQLKTMTQVDIPVIHRYSGGIYCREITIPAGIALTGRIYKDSHFDVMISGSMIVTTEGQEPKQLDGFNVFESHRGKKRAGYCLEETRWLTFHQAPEMKEDDYTDFIAFETFDEYDQYLLDGPDYIDESVVLEAFRKQPSYRKTDYNAFKSGYLAAIGCEVHEDREDYQKVLTEFSYTEEEALAEVRITSDLIDGVPDGLLVAPSPIQGVGLFVTKNFNAGDLIMKASVDGGRTVGGRYVNHSKKPNAEFLYLNGGDVELVALRDLSNEEITIDYRTPLLHRFGGSA